MIMKNPDESVLDEQSGAIENASGTDEKPQAEKAKETESPAEAEKGETEVKVKKRPRKVRAATEDEPPETDESTEGHTQDEITLPPVDYSGYSRSELVETLSLIVENRPPAEIRSDVDRIKILFYKKLRQEAEERKNKYLEGGGKPEEYRAWIDPSEARVKHLLDKYREKKSDFNKVQETEKYENLRKKYDIIDKIKELVNREESINKTFHEFRSLQNEWHSIGIVPQNALKDL